MTYPIPVLNILAQLVTPIIIAGLMLACRQQDIGGEISISIVLSAFSNRPGQLILLGVALLVETMTILIIMVILVIIILGGIESLAQFPFGELDRILAVLAPHSINLLLVALIGLMSLALVVMALLFAPALVVFHNMNAFEAMLTSFKACLLNVLPFLVYGILGMILMIIASAPALLGWVVLIPMLIASVYASYKDIFVTNADGVDSATSVTP